MLDVTLATCLISPMSLSVWTMMSALITMETVPKYVPICLVVISAPVCLVTQGHTTQHVRTLMSAW